jgi:hypothetical protein
VCGTTSAPAGGLRRMRPYHSLLREEDRLATQRELSAGRVCVVVGSTGIVLGVTLETSGQVDNDVYVFGGVGDLCMLHQAAHRVGRVPGAGRAVCTFVNDGHDFTQVLRANTKAKKAVKKDAIVSERRARVAAVAELSKQTMLLSLFARAVDKVANGKADNNMARGVTSVCLRQLLQIDMCCAVLSADDKSLDLSAVPPCACAREGRARCAVDVRRLASGVGGSSQQPRMTHRPSTSDVAVRRLITHMQRQREMFAASTTEMSLFGAAGFMPDDVIVEIARDAPVATSRRSRSQITGRRRFHTSTR